jgi:hypothetical protein
MLERSSMSSIKLLLTMLEQLSIVLAMAGKNKAAQALGKLGGLKGGKARAAKLTAEQRKEIAQKAATARWAKRSKDVV